MTRTCRRTGFCKSTVSAGIVTKRFERGEIDGKRRARNHAGHFQFTPVGYGSQRRRIGLGQEVDGSISFSSRSSLHTGNQAFLAGKS